VQAFINPEIVQGFARSHLELPSLPGVNIFINLFFERFSPQAPVLHHATVDTNDDLLPPLLAAMIVIGTIHSRLPGTGRFSVVLMDIVRWNLQTAIECDNKLMREPMIIYLLKHWYVMPEFGVEINTHSSWLKSFDPWQ